MKEAVFKALSSAMETAPNQVKSFDSPGKSSEIWRDDISGIPGDIFVNRRPLPVFKDENGIVPGLRPGTSIENMKPSESDREHFGEQRWGISGTPGESIESSRPLPVFRDGAENRELTASLDEPDSVENVSGLSKETFKESSEHNEVNESQEKDSSEQVDAATEQNAAQPKPEPVSDTMRSSEKEEGHLPENGKEVSENKKKDFSEKEVQDDEIQQMKEDYINDIVNNSEVPETIDAEKASQAEFKKCSPEETAQKREEFNQQKNDLIEQWEKENGREWPTYKEDVYSSNGHLIRRAGDKYDAHHIQPLSMGGKNEVSNITPLHAESHYDRQGVHSPTSAYSKLEQKLGA